MTEAIAGVDNSTGIRWIKKDDRAVLETKVKNGVPYLSFLPLEETGLVSQGFSTRLGGVSEGKFATMNFTTSSGDNPKHVGENYRRMAGALGVDIAHMVVSNQTHTTNIRRVTKEDSGKGVIKERDFKDIDGLITDVAGLVLVTFYADCVPLYLLDPIHHAIGLSHSGWRGTLNRMGLVTIRAMAEAYGSRAEDLIVCIGPSICQDCYEVGEDVASEFYRVWEPCDSELILMKKTQSNYQLNLWKANEIIFQKAGVKPENIHTTNICTHCNPDYLFSHRVFGNERGNLAAFMGLK